MTINQRRVGTGIVAALGGSLLILSPLGAGASNIEVPYYVEYVNRVCPGTNLDDCVPSSADSRGDAGGGGTRPGRVTVEPSTATVGSDRHLENLATQIEAKAHAQSTPEVFPTIGDMLAADAARYVEQSQSTVGSDRHLENLAAQIEAKAHGQGRR